MNLSVVFISESQWQAFHILFLKGDYPKCLNVFSQLFFGGWGIECISLLHMYVFFTL